MDYEKIVKLLETIPYDFRWAGKNDWKSAMMLVWKTFMAFDAKDYTREGIRKFFEFVSDDDLYKAFLGGNYKMMIALDGKRIIGVGTLRNMNLLSLLFVDENYHKQGVGSVLVELLGSYVRDEMGEGSFMVKASPYAVGFYEKNGFVAIEKQQERDGIRTTLMEKIL